MAGDQATGWEVTSQRETMEQDASGAYVHGYMVSFRSGSGAPGSVFVPLSDYTVERVRKAVAARAAAIDAVSGLKG